MLYYAELREQMSKFKKNYWELLLISFIALFLELVIIRWLSSEIRIFAYFKNLPLMAAFLGFGVGFWLHEKSDQLLLWFPRLFLFLVILIVLAFRIGITHVVFVDPKQFFLLGGGFGDHAVESIPSILKTIKGLIVIISVFFLVVATFATLTAKLGALMNQEEPLVAYSINVAGSLLGIIGFSLVSYFQWPPVVWLFLILSLFFYFYRGHKKHAAFYFLGAIGITFCAGVVDQPIWSPYYRIHLFKIDQSKIQLTINHDSFQEIQDLSNEYIGKFPEQKQRESYRHYNLPYLLSRKKIESVLILGGGTGNDAAAALRNGSQMVDVVEIDPAIARIGQEFHPEKPYTSKHVNLYIDDARSFLQKTNKKYDLVVFATLDSHSVFSSLSSLRMDNFVFTKESIQNVKSILKPEGGIAINFFAIRDWLTQRHYNTLHQEIGPPIFSYASKKMQEVIFLAGELFDPNRPLGMTDYYPIKQPFPSGLIEPTSDDWPFLFLEKRGIPFHYLLPLLIIFALAFIPLRMSKLRLHEVNWHLFFMGAAFLLIETKAVTTLALIFGSTWLVNSIVIGSILFVILLANLIVWEFPPLGYTFLYTGLCMALIFNFIFPFDMLNQYNWNIRIFVGSTIISLPIFFAALIFAKAFAEVNSPSKALAANLFGSLIGGLLEYLDMWIGLRSLNLIALILYVLSAFFLLIQTKSYSRKL
jgi:SAM-dependent methyltransferase